MSQTDHVPISQSDDTAQEFDHSTDVEFVSRSLIESGRRKDDHKGGYSDFMEPDFENGSENPYRDTTESDISIRHIPLSDLMPHPWKTFEQVMIASYISVVLNLVTGLLAVRYAWRGKRHQSKGLMGMAQKDLKLAVWFIYASVVLGILLFLVIIPIAASM